MGTADIGMVLEHLGDRIRSTMSPKSLSRYKTLSSDWARALGDRRLQDAQFEESKKQQPLVLIRLRGRTVWNDGEPQYQSFHSVNQDAPQPIADQHPMTTLTNSEFDVVSEPVRGLVCLRSDRNLLLCNPANRRFLTVMEYEPQPEPPTQARRIFNNNNNKIFSFGYDEETSKEFKLLQSERVGPKLPRRHQIMTVQPGAIVWRPVDCDLPYTQVTNSVFVGGKIYYGAVHFLKALAVCVDLSTESIVINELPDGFQFTFAITKLMILNGQPCFFNDYVFELANLEEFSVCVLEKDSGHWVQSVVEVWDRQEKYYFFSLQGTLRTGELVFAKKELEGGRLVLLYYDSQTKTFQEFPIQTEDGEAYESAEIYLNHHQSIYI